VSAMQISDPGSYWDVLMHQVKTSNMKPPWPVVYAVAALLGGEAINEINGSWTVYKPQEPEGQTTWAVFVVTVKRLVHVQMRFNAERHGLNENNKSQAASTIEAAWVRRLSDIASISIGGAETTPPPKNAPPQWFGVADVGIGFADGAQVVISIDQRVLGEDDRTRSEKFLTAIRIVAAL
jgi:hypothetical protein